jgi:hypothetical protein
VPRRIDLGDGLAALGALLVLISLFLEWFGAATGWEAFESLDLVLALLALGVIGAAAHVSDAFGPRALLPLGALLTLIVIVQLAEPPPIVSDDADLGSGAWLALGGSVLALVGGAMRAASFAVTISVGAKDARRRVPAVDRRQSAAPDRESRVTAAPPQIPDEPTQPFAALDEK